MSRIADRQNCLHRARPTGRPARVAPNSRPLGSKHDLIRTGSELGEASLDRPDQAKRVNGKMIGTRSAPAPPLPESNAGSARMASHLRNYDSNFVAHLLRPELPPPIRARPQRRKHGPPDRANYEGQRGVNNSSRDNPQAPMYKIVHCACPLSDTATATIGGSLGSRGTGAGRLGSAGPRLECCREMAYILAPPSLCS